MNNFCIVIQGPSTYVEEMKIAFDGIAPLVFSTWVGEENKYKETDVVVFNNFPDVKGAGNTNYHKVSTLNGLLKAKNLGYTRVLKLRSDMIPTHPRKFISLFDNDKLNFFSWHFVPGTEVYAYVVDYFMSGNVDDLIKMWSFEMRQVRIPEIMLTNSIIKNFEEAEINYVIHDLSSDNNVHWVKNNIYLDTYKSNVLGSWFDVMDLKTDKKVVNIYKTILP